MFWTKYHIELAISWGADLFGAYLSLANLSYANLSCANLSYANLFNANLYGANLSYANLSNANLRAANFSNTNLTGANLSNANLRWANLRWANLRWANLRGANLRGANLRGADLHGANLRGAKNIPALIAAQLMVPPQEGDLIGWKKCKDNVIVKLRIPAMAKRSSATTRKCRAEFAEVLEVIGAEEGITSYKGKITRYKANHMVNPDKWDDDRWNECSSGIHFFITREEAESY